MNKEIWIQVCIHLYKLRKSKDVFYNLFQTLGFHVQRRFYQTSFIFLMTCQLILGFPLGLCLLFYSDNGVYGMYFS